MDLSVVIPVKNEAENIRPLVSEIRAALDGLAEYEILYVDDGSSDGTVAEISRVAAKIPQIRLLRHARNCGQSAAIRTGVRAARASWIATLDGDGQNDPADIPGMWGLARQAPPRPPLMIVGYREKRRDHWSKRWASRIANAFRGRLLGDNTPDTGCSLKLFPRSLFLEMPFFDHMHRFLPALVLREGGTVRSVLVNHRPRRSGVSNYGVFDRLGVGIIDLLGVMWLKRRTVDPDLLGEVMRDADGGVSHFSRSRRFDTAVTTKGRPAAALSLPVLGLRRTARLALLGSLVLGAASAWHWRAILDPITITATIARCPAAPLGFLAVHIVASMLFIPRTLLAIVAGLLFGMGWGIVLAASGSVAGAVAGFLVARYINSGLIDPGRLGPVAVQVERGGWRAVAVLRLIPLIPHSVANYALGLTRLPLASYALGSLLGQLPTTIAYVDFGAAGERLMLGGANWVEPTLIGLAALALSLLIPAIARRQAG